MKCPNCSFLNADDAEVCKICGYDLNPVPPSKSRYSLDDADLDKSVDALFGTSEKRMSKKLDKRFEAYADMPDDDEANGKMTDKELHWLETLQRDMATVDEEFSSLRSGSVKTEGGPADTAASETVSFDNQGPIGAEHTPDQEENLQHEQDEYKEQKPEESREQAQETFIPGLDLTHDPSESAYQEETLESEPSETQERFGDDDDYDIINLNLLAKDPEKFEKNDETVSSNRDEQDEILEDIAYQNATRRNRIIILLVLAVIVFLILFKLISGLGQAKTPVDDEQNNPQIEEPAGLDDHMTSEVLSEQTGIFFGQLKAYVNDGNIAVLSRFENSQNALEQLNQFKNEGTLDDFRLTMPAIDDVNPLGTPITISVAIDRTIEGKSVTREDTWKFNWVYLEEQWLIKNLEIQSQEGTTTVNSTGDTEEQPSPTDNAGSTTPSTNNSTSTANTIKPEGFVTTGSFTGGIITDGQDVSSIRFGRHDAFDRLVFDLSVWTGSSASGDVVEEACHYEAKISDDGKSITLLLSGARGASATLPNLTGSNYLSGISVFYPEDDSAVGFNITLNQSSAFKTFSLKAPGRIVIDVMPK